MKKTLDKAGIIKKLRRNIMEIIRVNTPRGLELKGAMWGSVE